MIHIHLTEEQRQDLQLRARQEVGRVSERIHFVLLSDQGKSPPEIADLFGYSAASVRVRLKRYQAQGIEGPRPEALGAEGSGRGGFSARGASGRGGSSARRVVRPAPQRPTTQGERRSQEQRGQVLGNPR